MHKTKKNTSAKPQSCSTQASGKDTHARPHSSCGTSAKSVNPNKPSSPPRPSSAQVRQLPQQQTPFHQVSLQPVFTSPYPYLQARTRRPPYIPYVKTFGVWKPNPFGEINGKIARASRRIPMKKMDKLHTSNTLPHIIENIIALKSEEDVLMGARGVLGKYLLSPLLSQALSRNPDWIKKTQKDIDEIKEEKKFTRRSLLKWYGIVLKRMVTLMLETSPTGLPENYKTFYDLSKEKAERQERMNKQP